MNLIADIGNNSAKFFLFNNDQIILHTRKVENPFGIIREWKEQYSIEHAIVSSVIDLSDEQKEAFNTLGCRILWFDSNVPTPLKINYRTPWTLGSDRLAAAVGAWLQKPGYNILVIDAGSAVTIDFVDRNGVYHGGNSAPGIRMRLKALHQFTGRLPYIEKEGDTPVLGYDTTTAIRSGVIRGLAHEIDGYIEDARTKYGDVAVFLTGGDESPLKDFIGNNIFTDRHLVAKGLNRILQNYDEQNNE